MGRKFEKAQRRLLFVEDDEDYAFLAQRQLSAAIPDFVVDHALDIPAAESLLRANSYDLILSDLSLPGMTATEPIKHLRRLAPDVPLVVLSGNRNGKIAAQAIREGAQDFLCKDEVTRFSLQRSVQFALERHQLRAQVEQQNEKDDLTGLATESWLMRWLDLKMPQPPHSPERRSTQSVYLLYLDVDGFKAVNDEHGHKAGDALLREVAGRIKALLRTEDVFARLHGDEFAIAVESSNCDEVIRVAERCLSSLAETAIEGVGATVSVSIGIAKTKNGENPKDLLHRADLALYEAKRRGKNQFVLFDDALSEEVDCRERANERLRGAVKSEGFCFHLQPQFSVSEGRVLGAEALLRLKNSGRASVSAEDFVLLEREGILRDQVLPLMQGLFATCAQYSRKLWPVLTVNLSIRELEHKELAQTLSDMLGDSGLEADRLQLDIPEDALTDLSLLEPLWELGAKLAINQFGVGHSSLVELGRGRCNAVKIAPFCVSSADTDGDRVVASAVAVAKRMGMEAMAVGVETREHFETVCEAGCTSFQGNFFAAPMPVDDFTKWLTNKRRNVIERAQMVMGFQQRLPGRLGKVIDALELLQQDFTSDANRQRADMEMHRLVGAAGGYGNLELSERLRTYRLQLGEEGRIQEIVSELRIEKNSLLAKASRSEKLFQNLGNSLKKNKQI